MRCRHSNHSWLLCGGRIEWCYQCGAFRRTVHVNETTIVPAGAWALPSGPEGKNPWYEYEKKQAAWEKRKLEKKKEAARE